ncbi:unnamed protein product [Allacma fusca]|uniref:Polyprenal reductase n=1 Tax=Allacma fusca TaxID=39272 RepID=A0A8J2Q0C9_9HEXA|nr:unnamed protein product [Allacma fusca]
MNFLEYLFSGLTVLILILGTCTNYGDSYFPEWFLQIFRYGRANKASGKKWLIRTIEIPKSWFAHFYIYAVVLQGLVLYELIGVYTAPSPSQAASRSWLRQVLYFVGGFNRSLKVDSTTSLLASTLFFLHVLRRLYECWFVSVYSGNKMNVLHYMMAITHYTGCILSLLAHSVGFVGDPALPPVAPEVWTLSLDNLNIFHYWGLFLFMYGSFEQYRAHRQYADLRKGKGNEVATLTHQIPRGGLFEKVSSPNYWAEIIIYASLCVIFAFMNPTWNGVFIWVLCNQIVSGTMNHKWYQRTFPDYPKSRKAIIPYLW